MSANLVVDLANTCDYRTSVSVGSGSNLTVGEIIDLGQADTYTQIWCAGGGASGVIMLRAQSSDGITSGSFTDPTSGLVLGQFPVNVVSGGVFYANSGLYGSGGFSPAAPINNAPIFCSGGVQFGAFQRPGRYARLILDSGAGPFPSYITAGFVGNKRTTGSGGGFTLAPSSGTVNV